MQPQSPEVADVPAEQGRLGAGSSPLGWAGSVEPGCVRRALIAAPRSPQRRAAAGCTPVSLHCVWDAALHRREGTAPSALLRQAAACQAPRSAAPVGPPAVHWPSFSAPLLDGGLSDRPSGQPLSAPACFSRGDPFLPGPLPSQPLTASQPPASCCVGMLSV